MIVEALLVAAGIAALVTRTHINIIIRKDSTDMATIHEQLAQLTTEVAAIPAPVPATDLTPVHDAIAALTAKVDALAVDVGTPATPPVVNPNAG